MTDNLQCVVEQGFPVGVVRLGGTVDLASAGRLRGFLGKCLADQPSALVVDVSALSVADPSLVTIFATAQRRAAEWPGTAVILCAPSAGFAEALRRSAVARHLTICPTRAEALRVARARPVVERIREVYFPSVDAPAHARAIVAQACAAWGISEVAGPAQVIVSELVANGVVHGRTLIELSLAVRNRYLHISVRDGASGVVRPPSRVTDDAEHGRGLLVVGALATSWGVVRTGEGKVVWATIRLRPAEVLAAS